MSRLRMFLWGTGKEVEKRISIRKVSNGLYKKRNFRGTYAALTNGKNPIGFRRDKPIPNQTRAHEARVVTSLFMARTSWLDLTASTGGWRTGKPRSGGFDPARFATGNFPIMDQKRKFSPSFTLSSVCIVRWKRTSLPPPAQKFYFSLGEKVLLVSHLGATSNKVMTPI